MDRRTYFADVVKSSFENFAIERVDVVVASYENFENFESIQTEKNELSCGMFF